MDRVFADAPLAALLSLIGLVLGSIAYWGILRRRRARRSRAAAQRAVADAGLHGLVRVMVVDAEARAARHARRAAARRSTAPRPRPQRRVPR